MTKGYLLLGLAPILALAACGETPTNTSDDMAGMSMDGSNMADNAMYGAGNAMDNMAMPDEAVSPAQRFANQVAASDHYEIEAGRLAQQKAQSQALKDFGAMMVEHHGQSTEKLKAAGASASPTIVPAAALSAEQETNLAALRAADGAAFDTAYKAQQIAAHEQALALVRDYATSGDVPELRSFASEAQKIIQTHLTRIREI